MKTTAIELFQILRDSKSLVLVEEGRFYLKDGVRLTVDGMEMTNVLIYLLLEDDVVKFYNSETDETVEVYDYISVDYTIE